MSRGKKPQQTPGIWGSGVVPGHGAQGNAGNSGREGTQGTR